MDSPSGGNTPAARSTASTTRLTTITKRTPENRAQMLCFVVVFIGESHNVPLIRPFGIYSRHENQTPETLATEVSRHRHRNICSLTATGCSGRQGRSPKRCDAEPHQRTYPHNEWNRYRCDGCFDSERTIHIGRKHGSDSRRRHARYRSQGAHRRAWPHRSAYSLGEPG